MKFRILLVLLCAALWSADCGGVELTILHTSEHHGTLQPVEDGPFKGLGGVARRAAVIERIRKERPNVLVVDSGDLVIGTAMSSVFRGTPDVAAMSLIGYDAQALGNHDFDFGVEHLRELKKQASFPFLCASVRPKQAGICEPFVIKEVGSLRIGLIGLLGRLTFPDSFDPNVVKELDYRDPIEAVKSAVASLKGRVDLIVAVTHEETEEDLALAKAVPEIGVIIGGHTPGFDGLIPPGADQPVRGRVEPVARGPIFVKSHQQARTLGRLDLVIDKTIRAAEAENILIDAALPEEPKVAALVQYYNQHLETETQRVVGKTQVDLQGDAAVVRTRETNFGNLLADLALRQAGAEIALINSGSIRGTIPSGPVTLKQVMRVLPYNDTLVSLKLSGAEIWKAMENGVSRLPDSGRFLQVAGLEMRFDPAAPIGSRVKSIRLRGAAIQPERQYAVVVNGFMAEGGDGYTMFTSVRGRVDLQNPLRDLFIKALASGVVDVKEQGRIREEKR